MPDQPKNFALIGTAGYIAPRHLKAIHDTGNRLVAAVDPHDSVGLLDRYFPDTRSFVEIERFDRFLEKLRRGHDEKQIEYLTVCSPNYLHDAHVRLGLRVRANVICGKPLAINPWNLDQLAELQEEFGRRVYTILQLRQHPALIALKQKVESEPHRDRWDVCLTYVTPRGPWYNVSWKGSPEKSGGVTMNIGVHFFDLLVWLFGPAKQSATHLSAPDKTAGLLQLERASVRWYLSLDAHDLPAEHSASGNTAYRSITVDGEEIEFSTGFGDLHTRVYEEILAGHGAGIEDARPAIQLVYDIRHAAVTTPRPGEAHPLLAQ